MDSDQKIKSLLPYDMARGGQVIEKLDLTFNEDGKAEG